MFTVEFVATGVGTRLTGWTDDALQGAGGAWRAIVARRFKRSARVKIYYQIGSWTIVKPPPATGFDFITM